VRIDAVRTYFDGSGRRLGQLGQVPDGTSGQNERLIATELNTSGPYARTRNPDLTFEHSTNLTSDGAAFARARPL